VNAIEESFFERRYVGDQAGPGLVARIMLEHDDVVLWPPACFHPRVGETIRNPDFPRLLMQRISLPGRRLRGGRGITPGSGKPTGYTRTLDRETSRLSGKRIIIR